MHVQVLDEGKFGNQALTAHIDAMAPGPHDIAEFAMRTEPFNSFRGHTQDLRRGLIGVTSRNGENRTLAANPVSLKSMDWLIDRQKKPNPTLS
jgi:hypothetical protein